MLGAARHGQTHWLSDPEGYWYLKFKDVLGGSYLDRRIEVIKGRPIKGEPALLKTRTIYHHVDDARESWKRLQREGWRVTSAQKNLSAELW
ncbi:hypothetical [Prochlorococcus marinus str. MIT 9313]|uniref:Uncharacterized protein n=1 Tax=Prochlorococcus marinus (strain MIT 9313) TaxID=74547 RepID=Q7V7B5_PROMM|nr:DUF1651 domain-containing protein [Prochlorococcus marinus]CAE21009.1 hypothetical [Prochlorococcus marinus str. MIT 9313]